MARLKWLLLALVLLSPLGIDIYLPAIPAIANALAIPASLVQSTVSLFLLMMGLGQLIAGPLADRFGRRPVAMTGVLLYMLGGLMAMLADNALLFIASRLLQGTAVCCSSVVAFTAVRDRLDGEASARTYSFLNGALNIVPALAPLLGGFLAQQFGWQAPFGFLAGYAALLLGVIWRYLPETRPANTHAATLLPLRRYLQILRSRQFRRFSLVNSTGMGMVLSYVSLAPTVMIAEAGLSPVHFSLIFGANALWIMLASAKANWLIRRFGQRRCLQVAASWQALAVLSLMLSFTLWGSSVVGYMLPVALGCAGFACGLGPATSLALAPYKAQAGVAASLVLFMQMAGASLIGLLAVALPVAPQWALAATMLLAALVAYRAARAAVSVAAS